jgi:hypothetical protein
MRSQDVCSHSFSKGSRAKTVRGLVCLAVLCSAPFSLEISHGQQSNGPKTLSGYPGLPEDANPHPDGVRLLRDSMQTAENLKMLNALNKQRQKEMTDDTAKLLALAGELKTDSEKRETNALSVTELRKAEQIEKLARAVRDKMKATVGN